MNSNRVAVALLTSEITMAADLSSSLSGEHSVHWAAAAGPDEQGILHVIQAGPDVLLVDTPAGGGDSIRSIRRVKAANPSVQILMLVGGEDRELIFKGLAAGASGYIVKGCAPSRLLEAIYDVHAGGSPVSSAVARKLVQFFQHVPHPEGEREQLSGRERQVLHFLVEGFAYKQIAAELKISMGTTRTYIRRIYEKLHVHSRTQAVVRFMDEMGPEPTAGQGLPAAACRPGSDIT